MAQVTWGVKMNEEEKVKLQELIDSSGLNSKEFMNAMMVNYEMVKAKETVPVLSVDIDEIQVLTNRINTLFLNVSQRLDILVSDKERHFEEESENKNLLIKELQSSITDLESEKKELELKIAETSKKEDELNVIIVNLRSQLDEQVNLYKEVNQSNHERIEQFKEKTEALSELLTKCQSNSSKYEDLVEEYDFMKSKNRDLEYKNKISSDEVENLKKKIVELEKKHEMDLTHIQDQISYKKDREILDLEKKYQNTIQEIREKYSLKIEDLLKIYSETEEKIEKEIEKEEEN